MKKATLFDEIISEKGLELNLYFLCETWRQPSVYLDTLSPSGNKYLVNPKEHPKGGGLAVVI